MSKWTSALSAVYKGMVGRLKRKGVAVGGTASYPRVEVHSIVESEPMDKGGNIRSITCVVECISKERMADVMQMNEDNLTLLLGSALSIDDPWRIVDILPGQLQELTEVGDTTAALYRLLQNMTIFVERNQR